MAEHCRATLRCIRDDLGDGWSNAQQLREVDDGRLPFHDHLAHPVLDHVRETFASGSDGALRESISAVKDNLFWKLRTGRWRAAVWEDSEGTAWVCAAGFRRDGDTDDFYDSFSRACESGSGPYLPNDSDRLLQRRDERHVLIADWERHIVSQARSSVLEARASGVSIFEMPTLGEVGATCATVHVAVEVEEDEEVGLILDVVLSVNHTDRRQLDALGFAELVMMLSVQPRTDAWTPSSDGQGMTYSALLDAATFDQLRLLHNSGNLDRVEPDPPRASHYVHQRPLVEQYVSGVATRALCGAVFVPARDPEPLEACPLCRRLLDLVGT